MVEDLKSRKSQLQGICKKHKFILGLYYAVSGSTLIGQDHFTTDATLEAFVFDSKKYSVKLGAGLRGRVWNTGNYEWHENVQLLDEVQFARRTLAIKSNLKACFTVAVKTGSKIHGVMEFYLRETKKEDLEMVYDIKKEVQIQ